MVVFNRFYVVVLFENKCFKLNKIVLVRFNWFLIVSSHFRLL